MNQHPSFGHVDHSGAGGRQRTPRLLGFLAVGLILSNALATGAVAAAPSPGTSLSATKTMTGHLVKTFGWTIAKTATPSTLTLSNGDGATVAYKVTLTKDSGTLSGYFDGNICVTNTGSVATQGLAISDALTKPPAKPTITTVSVSVAAHPTLAAGASFCYPYRIDVPANALALGASYKDTASVTITNKSGPNSGPTPSTTGSLPTTPGTIVNNSVNVTDTNGGSWTFSASGFQTYNKTFNCDADAGTRQNTATITQTGQTASASVAVTCLDPDVRVTKSVDHATATQGDTIIYTVTVSNAGPGTAHGVTLSDTLPAGLNAHIDNTTDFALSGSALTLAGQPLASLASGASKTVHVTGTVPASACETTMANTATVAATNERTAPQANDSASASTAVSCVHLEVTKSADAATVTAGDPVGYLITVSNTGAATATGVTLTDTLPANTGLTWTVSPAVAACSITTGTLTCNFGSIGAGGNGHVHVTSPTSSATCGSISNSASATATNQTGTATSGPAQITVNCPDVTVTKTAGAGSIGAGDTAAFTIVVGNAGAGIARTVTLSDTLPAGVTWSEDSPDCSIGSGTLTCAFGDLGSGASRTFHVTGTTAGANCGTLTNTATASATNEASVNQGNNSSTATITVACPDVTVSKTASPDSISAGDTAAFTIVVSNAGSATAHGVNLSDPLPAGISWSTDAGTVAAGTLTDAIGDLAAGASVTIHVSGSTDAADCGTLGNTATVSASNEAAADGANNSSTASITVNCPNVTVVKTAVESSITAGDTAAYTIVVSNSGAGTARAVALTDTLPAGISWTDDSADCGVSAGVLSCAFGDLAPSGSATVHISGPSDAGDCGIVSNTANVSATNEATANQVDDSSTASITVNCAVIQISKDADGSPVQAGTTIGFLITVSNTGAGDARDTSVTDTLPTDTGTSWSIDGGTGQAQCSIAAGVLSCAFGDVAPGASVTVHISSPTTTATCPDSPVDNTASVTTSNDGSGPASGSVTVRCNSAPVANDQTATTAEDTPVIVTLTASDLDADPLTFAIQSLPATGTLVACSDSSCTTASAIVIGAALPSQYVRYTPPANANGTGLASFTFTANDGFVDSNVATVTIDVTAVNDAPVVTTTAGSLAYTENDPATAIDGGVTVTDVDNANLAGATVQITTGCTPGQDVLALASPPLGITAGYTAASCTLALTGSASLAEYQTALQAVTYANTSDNPSTVARVVTITANDGAATGSATRGITVAAVNDAPVNSVPGAQAVNEDTDLTFSGSLSVADVDAGAGSVQTTVSALHGTITPATGSGATVTGSGTASAVITGTVAQVNAALNGLKYKGTANFNSTRGSETLTITTNDQGNTGSGGPLSDTDTVAITVNAVNDAPTAAAKSFTVQANMKIVGLSGLLTGATDPDTGDVGYTASFTVNDVLLDSCAGGTISNVNTSAGTFDFDPPPGSLGPCTLKYRVDDSGNPAPAATSAYATITITINGPVIWFVDDSAAPGGNGRLTAPFQTIGAADAVDAASQRIFLYSGTYTQGITLNASEWLIGQGVTGSGGTPFDTLFGITPPTGTIARPAISGTRPTTGGPITLGGNNGVVRGLNINPAATVAGLVASGPNGLIVDEVSVTTSGAAAVNLGGGGHGAISLTSVNANGGTNGIVLNNFNDNSGSFSVSGNSSGLCGGQVSPVVAPSAADCTGGTIQAMTGDGISLNTTSSVSLTRVRVTGSGISGIAGTIVHGFTLASSWVSASGNAVNERGVGFTGLFDSAAITNSTVETSAEDNVYVHNTSSAVLDRLTISGTTIGLNSTSLGNDGISFEANSGGANMKLTVNASRFTGSRGDAIDAIAQIGQTLEAVITNNTFVNNHTNSLGGGVIVHGGGTVNFDVSNNTFGDGTAAHNVKGTVINISKSATVGTFNGRVSGNTIGTAGSVNAGSNGGAGIFLDGGGSSGSMNILVSSNQIHGYDDAGIHVLQNGEGLTVTGNTLNATFTANTTDTPATTTGFAGIFADIGAFGTDSNAACLDIGGAGALGNDFSNGDPFNAGDIGLSETGVVTVRLPGYAGAATNTGQVGSYLTGRNLNSGSTSTNISANANGYTSGAACTAPSFP